MLLLGIFLLLAACAHRQESRFVPADPSLAPVHELVATPFFPQRQYQCGPASLATLLTSQGVAASPDSLLALVYIPDKQGSLQAEMLVAPARFGLLGVRLPPDLDSLLSEVSAGRPVLVLQDLGRGIVPLWHYAVAIGYSLEKDEIYLRSGVERRRVYRLSVFLESWRRSDYWAMVVVPPDQVPVTARPQAFLKAAGVLERLSRYSDAQVAYLTATQRWPDSVPAWGGMGNTAFVLGDYAAAGEAYRRALDVDPDAVLLMNNLAMSLHRRGCRQTALAVIDCARSRRDLPLLQQTRDEIAAAPDELKSCGDFSCRVTAP